MAPPCHNRGVTRRVLEIETLADFDAHLARTDRLKGWFVQSVDLRERGDALGGVDPHGAVFLGCRFDPGVEDRLRDGGALLFPRLPAVPFDPYRPSLYTAAELYGPVGTTAAAGRRVTSGPAPYAESRDAAIYAWSRTGARPPGLNATLARTLHDHAVTDALDDATRDLDPTRVVGVMGGHALRRGDPAYRAAAELGRRLATSGRTVLTGGGPGAMEAANLGAYLSPWPDALDEALTLLAAAPGYAGTVDRWLAAGFGVRERWPVAEAGRNLSIPTWFYGHEPTNVFGTGIAKYFANALREDTLLHRCRGGIVYLPGEVGTEQEIFQAATENFYATDESQVAPMVLVGANYWTQTYPAWPLLERLGGRRAMGRAVHCVETVAEAAAVLDGTAGPLRP
ncbi:MAG: hypothetical protein JWP61_130 [Friedmanniella sp.]|nr:hypothetical protein [Friedmanniella sp.]